MVSPSSDALITGNRLSAFTDAWTKNGVTVSFTPERSNSAFIFSRAFKTFVTSTSKNVVTCAEVRRLITMCSAIELRIVVIGTRATSPVNVTGGAGAGAGVAGAAGAAGAGLAAGAAGAAAG